MNKKIESYEMKRSEVPECWLKPDQRDVIEALCKINDVSMKDMMIEQALDWGEKTNRRIF